MSTVLVSDPTGYTTVSNAVLNDILIELRQSRQELKECMSGLRVEVGRQRSQLGLIMRVIGANKIAQTSIIREVGNISHTGSIMK